MAAATARVVFIKPQRDVECNQNTKPHRLVETEKQNKPGKVISVGHVFNDLC